MTVPALQEIPTINLCGAPITIGALELIVKHASEKGEVVITGCGETSMMNLAAELMSIYDRHRT